MWRRRQRWKSHLQTQKDKPIKEELPAINVNVDDLKLAY